MDSSDVRSSSCSATSACGLVAVIRAAASLAGSGIDIACVAPHAEDAFLAVLGELLRAAQKAGTARQDVGVREVKAILVGCQAMEAYNSAAAERVTDVVIDGLRAAR